MSNRYHYGLTKTKRDNAMAESRGWLTIYYSYDTPIAVRVGTLVAIRKNDWSNTTARHMSYVRRHSDGFTITDKVPGETFEAMIDFMRHADGVSPDHLAECQSVLRGK